MELAVSILVIFGAIFILIGSIGLVRLPDVYMRMHAPPKATTLGLGAILIGSLVFFTVTGPGPSLHELLVTFFLFIVTPINANLIAKSAIYKQVPTRSTGDRELDETPRHESDDD